MKKLFALLLAAMLITGAFSGCAQPRETVTEDGGLLQGGLGAPGKEMNTYEGLIGCGYDIISSPYYQSKEVKSCALDTTKMAEDGLIYEDINAQRTTEFFMESGQDIYSYMSSMAISAGVETKSLFGGSLKVDFGLDTSSKVDEQMSFAKGSAVLTKVKQSVLMGKITDKEFKEKYLLDGFKEDLLNELMTPSELFDIYGTHIMLAVSLGGRLDMSYVYDNVKRETKKNIETSVEASWGAVSAKTSTKFSEETSFFFENSTLKVKSYGGRVDLNMSTFENAKANYQEWSKSIEETESLTLIQAGNLKSKSEMYPLWLLIDTNVPSNATAEEKEAAAARKIRQDAIKAEFDRLLKEAEEKLDDYVVKDTYIKDIYFGAHKKSELALTDLLSKTSEQLKIIKLDLNMSAKGYFIYLGYTTTTNPDEAIRGLTLHFHRNPPEYLMDGNIKYLRRLEYDLNLDAGGDDIFLFYTKDKAAGEPVKRLFVQIAGVTGNLEGQANWTRVSGHNESHKYDLNRNAGGKDIFLWMQKETAK